MKTLRAFLAIVVLVTTLGSTAYGAANKYQVVVRNTDEFLRAVHSVNRKTIIAGVDNTVIDLNGESLKLYGLDGVEFRNLTIVNAKYIKISQSKNVTFEDNTFENFLKAGIYAEDSRNVQVVNNQFKNIGISDISPSWQGSAVYVARIQGLNVMNNEVSYTYGHSGIFVSDSTAINVESNHIHDTFYRAIQLYDGTIEGIVKNNNIHDIGSINDTNSGVGANGIYGASGDLYGVDIVGNTITNVLENGIEGKFGRVENNVVDGTGIDVVNHPTPSTEGIYANGKVYKNNIVKNTHGDGIKVYSESTISDLQIVGNKMVRKNQSKAGISIISKVGYSNIIVKDNTVDNYNEILFLYNADYSSITYLNNQII